MKKNKILKVLTFVVAVVVFLCLLLLMPFMGGAVDWVAGVFKTTGDNVRLFAKRGLLTGLAVGGVILAIAIAAVLPVVAVVVFAVAVAAVVYAWWPLLFDSNSTDPGNTTITEEVENEDE